MAGAGGPMVGGPTPWWQEPQYAGSKENLEASAPSGYEYDPVTMSYRRTPSSAGQRAGQFESGLLGSVPSLAGLLGGGSGGSGLPGGGGSVGIGNTLMPGSGGPVGSGPGVPHVQAPDMTKSNDAIFGEAKDKVGKLSRASLDTLAGELGSQGMLGSGAQVQGTRDIVQSGAENLGNVERDLAKTNASTAADFAKTNFEGDITQRGQDINAQEANARLALESRQQQFQLLDMILKGIGGGAGADPSLLY